MFKLYQKYLNHFIIASIFLGALFAFLFPGSPEALSPIGDIFIRLLKLMIVPIIFFSLVVGILNLGDGTKLGRISLKAFGYYFTTTMFAVLTGLILVNLIQPGKNIDTGLSYSEAEAASEHSVWSVVMNIFPENIVAAGVEGNVLGLIFFSIFLALALLQIKNDNAEHIRGFFQAILDALLWMIDKIMLIAPAGIFVLIANLVADFVNNNQLESLGTGIAAYSITVVSGILVHGLFTLPMLLLFFKVNPFRFVKAMFPALSTAFSTASSMATLPITIECLKDNKVSNKIASFVAPLGGTINMDGTAIYEAVAVVFIANMYGVDLTFGQQILIFLTATFSAIGAAGTPGAGLVMMIMILDVVKLPAEGINLIIVVDRVLDMLRTTLNVWGDSIGAKIIDKGEK